jgi:hypothetical protein
MLRACAVWLALCGPVAAQDITRAELAEPTARYDHAVLGDALEWGVLHLWLEGGERRTIRLPETRVFEDIEARLADLDGDGTREVVVVEADLARGAGAEVLLPDGGFSRLISSCPGRAPRDLGVFSPMALARA